MILSNDQKHTFTAFGARAFMRKEETTTEGEEEKITSFFHARAAFLPFLYSCCNELLLELSLAKKRFFVRVVLSFCDFCLWSLQLVCFFECFCSVCSIQFSHFIRTTTNAYIIITISQRRERKREKEKGEKLFAAFPSHHRKTSSTK